MLPTSALSGFSMVYEGGTGGRGSAKGGSDLE